MFPVKIMFDLQGDKSMSNVVCHVFRRSLCYDVFLVSFHVHGFWLQQ